MATEIIHEHDHTTGDSGSGIIVAVVLLIVFAFLILYFLGNGVLRGLGTGGTSVQIPDKVNVNVQGPQGGSK